MTYYDHISDIRLQNGRWGRSWRENPAGNPDLAREEAIVMARMERHERETRERERRCDPAPARRRSAAQLCQHVLDRCLGLLAGRRIA